MTQKPVLTLASQMAESIHACHDVFMNTSTMSNSYDMSHSYVGHDSFTRGAERIHVCDMTLPHVHTGVNSSKSNGRNHAWHVSC